MFGRNVWKEMFGKKWSEEMVGSSRLKKSDVETDTKKKEQTEAHLDAVNKLLLFVARQFTEEE